MKKMILLFVAMLVNAGIWAQLSISGKVSDTNGEALPGTNILLAGTAQGVVSDAEGNFSLQVAKAGDYQLIFRFLGFKQQELQVEVPQQAPLAVVMEEDINDLDILYIYGKPIYPVTKTTVSKQELDKLNLGQDLPILIRFTPSIVTTSDAGAGVGYTGFRIRGSDPQRINVTVNGIPLNDAESHGVFWVNMPDFASSVENLTIQRGVGTSTNGAAAFGATVSLNTLEAPEEAFAEYNGSYGSFNTWKNSVQFGSGRINDKFSFAGRLSKITSDGFIDKASVDLKSFFLTGNYRSRLGEFTANIFSGKEITFQAWNGVPEEILATGNRTYNELAGYDNEIDNYQQDHYQLIHSKQLNDHLSMSTALHYTKGRGYFEQYKASRSFDSYGLENPQLQDSLGNPIEVTDVIVRRWLDNDFYGFVGSVNYKKGPLDLVLGGGWNRYEGQHFGEVIWAEFTPQNDIRSRYYDNDATKRDWNVYGKATYELTAGLYAFADLQFRGIKYDFIGEFEINDTTFTTLPQEASLDFFNPKFGLKYYRGKHEFYGSYAIANKEPNRDDFVDNTQNSRPAHETLRNLEVGYAGNFNDLRFGANFYWMDYENQLILTGKINDVGAYTRQNVAESYRAGLELQLAYAPTEDFNWQINATFSQNKIGEYTEFLDVYDANTFSYLGQQTITYKDTDIAFSPNLIVSNIFTLSPAKGLEAGVMTKYVGKQYLDNTSSDARSLDAYLVTDLRLSYNFKTKGFENVGLSLLVNNVLEELYESNGYTFGWLEDGGLSQSRTSINYFYPQAGRNFLFGIQIRI